MSKIMRMELQAEFKDLIQQAIHHPTKFDPCEVNHDMHESAWSTNGGAIEGDGIEIIGLWNYGDGSQAVKGARVPAVKGARDWLLHLQIPGSDPGIGLGCNMLYIILLSCYISLYAAWGTEAPRARQAAGPSCALLCDCTLRCSVTWLG